MSYCCFVNWFFAERTKRGFCFIPYLLSAWLALACDGSRRLPKDEEEWPCRKRSILSLKTLNSESRPEISLPIMSYPPVYPCYYLSRFARLTPCFCVAALDTVRSSNVSSPDWTFSSSSESSALSSFGLL